MARIIQILLTTVIPMLFRSRRTSRVSRVKMFGWLALLGGGAYLGHQQGWLYPLMSGIWRVATSAAGSNRTGGSGLPNAGTAARDGSGLARNLPSARAVDAPSAKSNDANTGLGQLVPVADAAAAAERDGGIGRLFRERRSDIWVAAEGRVTRMLADDDEGARHQCFIVEVAPRVSVKIAHNIDAAPRVPVESGMTLRFRGEYKWTAEGGVVHFTHRPESGRREGGWIELAGKRYE
ncbi:MAG: DUF3465 domain-containing protein [Phycisphaerae bacterium]